jgi:pimeloyl-ACP methyl ester carboxylesterase
MTKTMTAFFMSSALTLAGALGTIGPVQAQTTPESTAPMRPLKLYSDSKLIQGERISVEVVGSGPDLIFVPGLSSSRETWKRTADRLRGRYRLHLVQVNGFAGAPALANGSGPVFEPTAEAIDAYIVSAHLAPATYVGHSLGGTIGLYLAEHHPEHLKKVMMVDALPFYGVLLGGPTATSASIKPMAEGIRMAMIASSPDAYAARSAQTIAFMVKDPEGIKEATAWGRVSDRAVVATAMSEDMQLDLRPGLPAIKTPMTLVYPFDTAMGQPLDQWDGLYKGQYAPLTTLKFVRVDDSKHFVMFDQPAKFDAALDAFLAS